MDETRVYLPGLQRQDFCARSRWFTQRIYVQMGRQLGVRYKSAAYDKKREKTGPSPSLYSAVSSWHRIYNYIIFACLF